MTPLDLLRPMLAAALVCALLLAAAALLGLWKGEPARRLARWLAPAAGFLIGAWWVRGLPALPPVDVSGWVWAGVAVAALVGCLAPPRPIWLPWLGRIVAVGGLAFAILRPLLGREFQGTGAWIVVGGTAALWLILWLVVHRQHRATAGWLPLTLLLLSTIALSIVLMTGGTATLSQYALALAGVLAGAGLWTLPGLRRWGPDARPATALLIIPWAGLLAGGYFYADVDAIAATLLALSLFSLVLPTLPDFLRLKGLKLITAQIIWVAVYGAAAVAWTYRNAPRFDF